MKNNWPRSAVPSRIDKPNNEQPSLHSVSVAGIVVNNAGEILAICRDNGHWEPPGVVLELGETLEEGARRKVHEETGVNVQVEHLTGAYKNMERGIVSIAFRCTPLNESTSATTEAAEVRWISLDEIKKIMNTTFQFE